MNSTARSLLIAVLSATGVVGSAGILGGQEVPREVGETVQLLEAAAGGPVRTTLSRSTDRIGFLAVPPQRSLKVPVSASAPAETRARAFFEDWGRSFGVADARELTFVRGTGVDEVGMEHVRFQQTRDGVPVTGGELVVHLRGNAVIAASSSALPDLEATSTVPSIAPSEARTRAWQVLADRFATAGIELSDPRLELFNRGLLQGRAGETRLAWFVEARRIDVREFIWIDAATGKLLLRFSQLTEARDRDIYDANDPGDGIYGDLPGALARSEGEGATGDADIDAAYDYSGHTHDYFSSEHGLDSYDGAGATLVSTVHFCPESINCPFANAFWNGIQMVYGEGFSAADDVAAHELTHAVTEFAATLFYYMQSGALNESFSDIFGESVDLDNGAGTDLPNSPRTDGGCSKYFPGPTGDDSYRWLMGEDVPGIGAIRDMWNPTCFGDPGKMSDADFWCADDYTQDNGGVHFNSGVPNHAYALMVDGGTYNGQTVTGIGLEKAGKIQYRALAYYLTSAANFLDNYNALLQSCQDLIGSSGISSADCLEVEKALDAVEMSAPWPCTPAPAAVPAYCPAGAAPEIWYYEDVESGFGTVPTCPSGGVLSAWCVEGPGSVLGSFATSGVNSLWGYNAPTAGTISVWGVFGGPLPANMRMQFNHAHGFENSGSTFWDGGLVEYTTDGGTSWMDAGALIAAGQAYGGTINASFGNPCGGQSAFGGDSWGYTASQLDLGTTTGGTGFGYRFTVCTDSSIDEYGWFVDDIRIYECTTCPSTRTLGAGNNGTASEYEASVSIAAGGGFVVAGTESVVVSAPVVELDNDVELAGEFSAVNAGCP